METTKNMMNQPMGLNGNQVIAWLLTSNPRETAQSMTNDGLSSTEHKITYQLCK
jgi:hypothetical protein